MKKIIWHIPKSVLIHALNETLEVFKGHCTDNWGELEASYCRKICGEKYEHIETDWIRRTATGLRKQGKLIAVNGGPKRKRLTEAQGEYLEYLKSPHWVAFRQEVLEFWDSRCCLCKDNAIDVHHNTYIRRGNERLTDCVALCKRCHARVHGVMVDGNSVFDGADVLELF